MGFYKNYRDMRSDVRRYNAAVRRANNLAGKGSSQLIHIETVSEIERYTMAKDADRLVAFNKDVQKWMNSVAAQLRASISSHSMRVATDLRQIWTHQQTRFFFSPSWHLHPQRSRKRVWRNNWIQVDETETNRRDRGKYRDCPAYQS